MTSKHQKQVNAKSHHQFILGLLRFLGFLIIFYIIILLGMSSSKAQKLLLLFTIMVMIYAQNNEFYEEQEQQQTVSEENPQQDYPTSNDQPQDFDDESQNNYVQDTCPIAQYIQFTQKQCKNCFQLIPNPYINPSSEYLAKVQQNLKNLKRVCAINYLDKARKTYEIKNFNTREEAEDAGWIVTHQGICGKCSTMKDLYVYLTTDLTKLVRACGLTKFYSENLIRRCILDLGFTRPCAQIWLDNTLHTKKHCGLVCFGSYIMRQPYVIDGKLNKCLQCDEDKSGPIFKYESGRSRRNSGIKSEIDRPSDQIYNITHCYY